MLAAVVSCSLAAPFELSDLFPGLSPNVPVEQAPTQDVVKRQVLSNPDGELKQISFQTLIGDLENSLFQSALSLHGASAPDSEVDEVQPGQAEPAESNDHSIAKRADEVVTVLPVAAEERKILVQTTKKVPVSEDGGVPAHLIIDHVSVQPHSGLSVPLIPTFQVHHTKITSATIKEDADNDGNADGTQTKISITKTSITSTAPVESIENLSSSTSSTTESQSSSSESSTSSTSTTTSEQPIVTKLKEKVAEVEAEPVILTARV
ncbi:hypothetical protein KR044_011568 [Drosophila immigrans]|nr:hypothetical protein KR044_011568 [Drosophila immigrans]